MEFLVTTHTSILSILVDYLIIAVILLVGLGVFALLAMVITNYSSRKERRLKRLESDHHMRSQADTNQRMNLLWKMRGMDRNSKEYKDALEQYKRLSVEHGRKWNARVKEMLDIEFPIDDATQAELDAGINPYRRRK